ncbi:MAG: hypothetical protein HY892_18580 [Deltaproteobacteria bacterium]|nr:hypothetical protein [Deltaproteobacteria bacterium]
MDPSPSIAKVCTKAKIGEQQSDFAYWQTQPYARRLAALEEIRREFHRWKYDAEPGFQRVYSVVKRRGIR